MGLLSAEAPAFLHSCLNLQVPPSGNRLRIPVVDTPDKLSQMEFSQSELDLFIADNLVDCLGATVPFSEFWDRFSDSLRPVDQPRWSPRRVGREFKHHLYVKGRYGQGGHIHIGNCTWKELAKTTKPGIKLVAQADRLVKVTG